MDLDWTSVHILGANNDFSWQNKYLWIRFEMSYNFSGVDIVY